MKPTGRILLQLATALSLILCILTVLLWIRTAFRREVLARERIARVGDEIHGTVIFFGSAEGLLWCGHIVWFTRGGENFLFSRERRLLNDSAGQPRWMMRSDAADRFPGSVHWFAHPGSIGWIDTSIGWDGRMRQGWTFTLPHWLPALAFALLPACRAISWRRGTLRKRRAALKGICVYCGYDLRATPQRCPECGTIPDAHAQSVN